MPRGREVYPDHLDDEPGCAPDADSRHARQNRVKRVRLNDALDLPRDLIALSPQLGELLREARKHCVCSTFLEQDVHEELSHYSGSY